MGLWITTITMDSFCPNPFFLHTFDPAEQIHCCWMDTGADLDAVQREMLSGNQPQACHKCWKAESAGLPSKRTVDTKKLLALTGWQQEDLINHAVNDPDILTLQIRLGNDCNLACKTCYPQDSTRWYSEWNHYHPLRQFRGPIRQRSAHRELDYAKLRHVEFLGGEPFVGQRWRPYLERLLAAGNRDLLITFTTNGTVKPDLDLISQFANVNINISIDGVGPRFEYLRWPAQWETVDENIAWWQSQRLGPVSACHTLSNLTIGYLDEFLPFALKRFGVGRYSFNVVDKPRWLAPHVLPDTIKHSIRERYRQHRIAQLLEPFARMLDQSTHPMLLKRFVVEMLRQDAYRRQHIGDYLPEIVFFDDHRPLRKGGFKVQTPLAIVGADETAEVLPGF